MSLLTKTARGVVAGIALLALFPTFAFAGSPKNPIAIATNPTTGLPSSTAVGNAYSVQYTFTNNLPFAEGVAVTSSAHDSQFVVTDDCTYPAHAKLTANGGQCTVTVLFRPTEAGAHSITLTLTYDRNVIPLPTLSTTTSGGGGTGVIVGNVTEPLPALPENSVVGVGYDVTFTYTNEGTAPVTATSTSITGDTGDFVLGSNGCNSPVAPTNHCSITGVFTPSSAGVKTLGTTYTYSGGTVPLSTTTTAVTSSGDCEALVGSGPLLLPTQTYQYADNIVKLQFKNSCPHTAAILGDVDWTATLGDSSHASNGGRLGVAVNDWIIPGTDGCSGQTLAAGGTCTVLASVIPETTGSNLAVHATVSYHAPSAADATAVATTTSSVVNANNSTDRMITVINQCSVPVWMSFVAAAAPGTPTPTCTRDSDCATGQVCYTGNDQCYWANPSLDGSHPNGKLAAALPNTPPDTMNIVVPENNAGTTPVQNILYNAGIVPRLGCTGSGSGLFCTANNCGGTTAPAPGSTDANGLCTPGVGVSTTPGMSFNATEFTFLRYYGNNPGESTTDGVYDEQTINGVLEPMEMKGRGTASTGSLPYDNCPPAGGIIQKTNGVPAADQLGACTYDYSTPATLPPDPTTHLTPPARASSYRFVTAGGASCADSDSQCTVAGQVCGLSYVAVGNAINKTCGTLIGYVSVNTGICSQADALYTAGNVPTLRAQYHCDHSYTYSTGKQLYACSGVYAGKSCYNPDTSHPSDSCCGCVNWWDEGISVPTNTQTCTLDGTLYSNPNWTDPDGVVQSQIQWVKTACPTAYSYQYDDPSSSFHCTVTNSSQIVTNYQVTFCPGGKQVSYVTPS